MDARSTIQAGKAILGIEFGSTRIKGVLIDEENKPIAQGSHEWENKLVDGLWSYSIEDIWAGIQDCYADLRANVPNAFRMNVLRHDFPHHLFRFGTRNQHRFIDLKPHVAEFCNASHILYRSVVQQIGDSHLHLMILKFIDAQGRRHQDFHSVEAKQVLKQNAQQLFRLPLAELPDELRPEISPDKCEIKANHAAKIGKSRETVFKNLS